MILGPSGCGKTTLLNIIGGLDHYTSGDLLIDSRSTKNYNEILEICNERRCLELKSKKLG